jgi:hypothetical protein
VGGSVLGELFAADVPEGEGMATQDSKDRKIETSAPRVVRQSADAAHAPGKRHRKPAPSLRGAKKSNQSIPKMRTATVVRQRRKSYA